MHQADLEFFEAYKHLEKICNEIFDCNNGVSQYISEMEETTCGFYKVLSWRSDYNQLKHVRWVRNKIVHETAEYRVSEEDDLAFVKSFYERIMGQEDPITLLRKEQQAKLQPKKTTYDFLNNEHRYDAERQKRKRVSFFICLFIAVEIAAFLFIYFSYLI